MRSRVEPGLRLASGDPERGAVSPHHEVDELDQRIIEALQRNGRESFRAIAARVGVSEATVRGRYGRLTREGILQVVGAKMGNAGDEMALDQSHTDDVGRDRDGDSGDAPEVGDEISKWPEADYVVVTAGRFDVVVEVVTSGRTELLELTNRIRGHEGVVSTETFLYLEMWKQLYDWGAHGGN